MNILFNYFKKYFLFIIILVVNKSIYAQPTLTPKQIEAQPDIYYWGEGKAATREKASNLALADLVSKISVNVQSSYQSQDDWGTGQQATEKVRNVINTYSAATLENVKLITIQDNDEATILFYYIEKKEVEKIFDERLKLVYSNLNLIENSEDEFQNKNSLLKQNNIGDVLKYYSWSLILLKSMPNGLKQIKHTKDTNQPKINLYSFIKQKLQEVMNKIEIQVANFSKTEDFDKYELKFLYNKQPISNIGFKYKLRDGSLSNKNNCIDGLGMIEFGGVERLSKVINIHIEYLYKDVAIRDAVYQDLSNIFELPLNNYRRTIEINENVVSKLANNVVNSIVYKFDNAPLIEKKIETELKQNNITTENAKTVSKQQVENLQQQFNTILQQIQKKDYQSIEKYCTPESWQEFQKIIKSGNAAIFSPKNQQINIDTFEDKLIVRPIKVQFKFNNNKRVFNENLIFTFNKDNKIERIHIGLNDVAIASIMENPYTYKEKQLLINAMETYKTAYFLKDINFLRALFDENAYIILGKVLKKDDKIKDQKQTVKLIQQNKKDYLDGLERVFKTNEYVNIEFEKSLTQKVKENSTIYGINIKQNYYSASYGDQGYLLLIMDLKDFQKPNIKVRVWQPFTDTIPPVNIQNYFKYLNQ